MPFDQTNYLETKPEVELERWRKVLLDAAQIVRRGWCQMALEDGKGRFCALGALHIADGDIADGAFSTAGRKAFIELNILVGGFIPGWNNAPGRTAEEVAAAMEACARQP
jgi:hypothetical protein